MKGFLFGYVGLCEIKTYEKFELNLSMGNRFTPYIKVLKYYNEMVYVEENASL